MIADEEATLEEIAKRGTEAVAKIDQQFTENADQIDKIEAEIAAIREARQDIADLLAKARGNVLCLEDAYRQAIEYAKFAQGTPREQETIIAASSAKKEAQAARKALEKVEQEAAEAKKSADSREAELSSSLQSLQAEQERLEAERDGTKAAHAQAHLELGKQKQDAYFKAFFIKSASAMALKEQLVAAEMEKHEVLMAASEDLAPWPELQQGIQAFLPLALQQK